MGGEERYLIQVGIDWSEGKKSTQEFLASVQARIAELQAKAGQTAAQGGLNPSQVGDQLGQLELALQKVKALAANVTLPGVAEGLRQLEQLESLLKTGQGFNFNGYAGDRAQAPLTAAFNRSVNTGGVIVGPGGDEEEKSAAQKQRDKAADTRTLAADDEYLKATADLAAARKTLAANTSAALAADRLYLEETVRAATEKLQLESAERSVQAGDQSYLEATVLGATTRNALEAIERGMKAGNEAYLESTALAAESRLLLSAVENETLAQSSTYLATLVRDETAKNNLAAIENETFAASGTYLASLKRATAAQEARTTAEGGTAATSATPKRGGFLGGLSGFGGGDVGAGFGQRLASSAAFFASGTLIFTAINELRQSSEAAQKLQVQLSIIKSQLEDAGDTGSAAFERINDKILQVSINTGTTADEVALVSRRLAGVFADDQGTPNFTKGLAEAQDAFKLQAVTGLPTKEITDDLVAISSAFDVSFKNIGDLSIGLGQTFGQSEADIIQFTAALAPTAQALGFTAEQLAGLGAVAQEFSGQSGASLAENFRRILPALQQNQTKIFDIFAGSGDSKTLDSLIENFAKNDIPSVLKNLIEGYKTLNPQQQNLLASTVGARREAGAFFTILEHGDATLRGLGTTTQQYAGDLDKRFNEVKDTVSFAFKQMNRALEEFAITLFQSGIGEALTDIAHVAGILFAVAAQLLNVFGSLNDMTHGLGGELIGLYLAFKGIAAIWEKLIALRTVGIFGGLLRGGGAAVAAESAGGIGVLPVAEGAAIGAVGPRMSVAAGALLKNASIGNAGLTGFWGTEGGVSGAGAIGAGLASFIAVAAPFIAFLALSKLYTTVQEVGASIGNAKNDLRESVLADLKKGLSPDQIRSRIPKDSDLSFGESLASYVTGQGTDNPKDVVDQVIQKFYVDATQKYSDQQIAIFKDYLNHLTSDDKTKLPGQFGRPDPSKTSDALAGDYFATQLGETGQKVTDNLKAHPDDPQAKADFDRFVAEILKSDIPQVIKDKIKNSQDQATKVLAALAEEQKQLQDATAIDTAITNEEAALSIGSGSSQVLIDKLRQSDAILEKAIKAGIEAGNDVSVTIAQLAKQKEKLSQQLVTNYDEKFNLNQTIAGFTGADTPAENVDAAKEKALKFLADSGVSRTEKIKAATDLAKAEQAAYKQQVDDAKTLSEKIALANQGFSFSDEAQVAIAQAELLTQQNQDVLTKVASDIGVSVYELENLVSFAMVDFGKSGLEIVKGIIAAQLDLLAKKSQLDLAAAKISNDYSAYSADVAGIYNLDKDLKGVDTSGLDAAPPPKKGGLSAADKHSIQQQGISSAQEDANAALDVEAARADGDAIELARIAKERANIEARFAVTNAEKLKALADSITADFGITKANLQYNVALRDLANAQAGDDPVVVARNALDTANEAAANAHGPIAAANAQAAQIRAEHVVAQTIQDLADSQVGILIAMSEASGDSVKVAQLKLKELTDRLANADALGLNEGQRNALAAQITTAGAELRDQTLSTKHSDIEFQLAIGAITKGQAIAALQELMTIPNLTKKEIQDIQQEIYNLRKQLGADYKFNLPSVLGLPTVYEVRRLGQSGGGLSGGYQDNRIININISALTNASPGDIANAVSGVIGPPNQFSTYSNKY